MRRPRTLLGAAASVIGLTMVLAGCSADGSGAGSDAAPESLDFYGHTVTLDQELADRVPDEWKSGIVVPMQTLRPNAFVDENNESIGMQPDLVSAIAVKLGIPVRFEVAPFDAQVPGVQSGQYAFTTATGDFPERREILTMVDYTLGGLGWLVRVDSDIKTLDDVCGKMIGVAKATAQEVMVEDTIKDCDEKGMPGTEFQGYSNTLMSVPLEAERIDVAYDSISSVLYFANSESDKFAMLDDTLLAPPMAMGVPVGETEKIELLHEAIQDLMDEGVYEAIFANWDLDMLMLDKVYINSEGWVLED